MKWLFLVHRIYTRQSRERVKIWRMTRKVGALLYRNSVYVLPYNNERLEDFHWLCQQIRDSGGEASVFLSEARDQRENTALIKLFRDNRAADYAQIREAATGLSSRIRRAAADRRLNTSLHKTLTREVKQLSEQCAAVSRVDFFPRPGASGTREALEDLERQLALAAPHAPSAPARRHRPQEYRRRLWGTRSHIHIDRLCSAWLIRRFVDPGARFVFAPEASLPAEAIPFDTFGVEFSHHGEDCTFETLLKAFRLKNGSLAAIAQIVHDIDMKDAKFNRPEAAGLDAVVRALSAFLNDDNKTLEVGSIVLDSLYRHLSSPKKRR